MANASILSSLIVLDSRAGMSVGVIDWESGKSFVTVQGVIGGMPDGSLLHDVAGEREGAAVGVGPGRGKRLSPAVR